MLPCLKSTAWLAFLLVVGVGSGFFWYMVVNKIATYFWGLF